MVPCNVIQITTPNKYLLNGLWFGSAKAKRVVIVIHGLGGSAFSRIPIAERLADEETAAMTFSNRGHDTISRSRRINARKKGGFEYRIHGAAHEAFTDCVDDIQGAVNFAREQGADDIYLVGHSTGCQKAVYFATKKPRAGIRGIVLLAPISDYAAALKIDGKAKIRRGERLARALVRARKGNEIVPGWWMDAQRFLSLHTPESTEEMFTYAQPKKRPRIYASVKVPVLALFAEWDEYGDRPAYEIEEWFLRNSNSQKFESAVIPKADHGFKGLEGHIASRIREWIWAE